MKKAAWNLLETKKLGDFFSINCLYSYWISDCFGKVSIIGCSFGSKGSGFWSSCCFSFCFLVENNSLKLSKSFWKEIAPPVRILSWFKMSKFAVLANVFSHLALAGILIQNHLQQQCFCCFVQLLANHW